MNVVKELSLGSDNENMVLDCYKAMAKALTMNDENKEEKDNNKDDEKDEYKEESKTDENLPFDAKNNWVCANCGNHNYAFMINHKIKNHLPNCYLCGIKETTSILLKLRQWGTFINQIEDELANIRAHCDQELTTVIKKKIKEKKCYICCPQFIEQNKICDAMLRLTQLLLDYQKCLEKEVNIKILTFRLTFNKEAFSKIVDKSIKKVEELKDKTTTIETIKEAILALGIDQFQQLSRKEFIIKIDKSTDNKLKRKIIKRVYNKMQALFLEIARDKKISEYTNTLEKAYAHILKYHMTDLAGMEEITKENVFKYFQAVIMCDEKKCSAYRRYGQNRTPPPVYVEKEEKKNEEIGNRSSPDGDIDFNQQKQQDMLSRLAQIHNYLCHTSLCTDNNIPTQDDTSKNNDSKDIENSKYISTDYHFGVDFCYLYMENIYSSIKAELTQNKQYYIDFDQFETKLYKAILKHKIAIETYKLKCDRYVKGYNIIRNSYITIRHILAIVAYTDFTNFCTKFRATHRPIKKGESDESVRKRHQKFYLFGRALFEAVKFYGQKMGKKKKVYYGLDKEMTFGSYTRNFNQPISTTNSLQIAHNFSHGKGIILTFKRGSNHPDTTPKYLNVSWMSDLRNEEELLFYGENVIFEIHNIYQVEKTGNLLRKR